MLVVWSIKPFLVWLTATYTITTKRLITREGLISRRGHDIPLPEIASATPDWERAAALTRKWELRALSERLEGLAKAAD